MRRLLRKMCQCCDRDEGTISPTARAQCLESIARKTSHPAEICAPGNETAKLQSEELRFTRPYCDLEVCPDPDPLPPGYERVGEGFRCLPGFAVASAPGDLGNCQHRLQLRGCSNSTDISIMITQLSEDCGSPLDAPEGYGQEMGVMVTAAITALLTATRFAFHHLQTKAKLWVYTNTVPIEPCLPIIPDGCDQQQGLMSFLRSERAGGKDLRDPLPGNIDVDTPLPRWQQFKFEVDYLFPYDVDAAHLHAQMQPAHSPSPRDYGCPRLGLPIKDGYIKDTRVGAPDHRGDAMVTCNISEGNISVGCEAEAWGDVCGCDENESIDWGAHGLNSRLQPPLDACEYNMPPYIGSPTVAYCAEMARPINRTSQADPVLDYTLPQCTCPTEGYIKVNGEWQCDEGYAGMGTKDPIVKSRGLTCEKIDASNCSEEINDWQAGSRYLEVHG
ncbi:hypothetical protein AK812_SmicGene8874 [Symbiodinium microadriaticum]|uniref:Uncharacterized protein n=1 Tax=Symbiodinium microadriaticum TaxID=2951 RepID=A0A1Q9EJS5_SYMMI|nr:hypothetical protein AK812_SmicGene8874 [Symbiodinium microadriaticum]